MAKITVKKILDNFATENTELVIYDMFEHEILFESDGKNTPDGWLYETVLHFRPMGNKIIIAIDMPPYFFEEMANNIYEYFNEYNDYSEMEKTEKRELETALKTVFKLSANDRNVKTLWSMLEMLNERAKDW
jgi:hypothetical protein